MVGGWWIIKRTDYRTDTLEVSHAINKTHFVFIWLSDDVESMLVKRWSIVHDVAPTLS